MRDLVELLRANAKEPHMTIGGKPFAIEAANEIEKLRNALIAIRASVVRAAVVKRPIPDDFWPNVKERKQIWDIAYGYGVLDCLSAIKVREDITEIFKPLPEDEAKLLRDYGP